MPSSRRRGIPDREMVSKKFVDYDTSHVATKARAVSMNSQKTRQRRRSTPR